jgi:hypothetical protein
MMRSWSECIGESHGAIPGLTTRGGKSRFETSIDERGRGHCARILSLLYATQTDQNVLQYTFRG